MAEKLKVWAYNDVHNWGSMLAQAAAARGHDAHLFEDPRQPDSGYAFMHMHYHPQVREMHKRIMSVMAMNPNVKLIPSYRMSVMHDDKAEQARQLAQWMPRTHIFWTPNGARNWLEKSAQLPFVSKAKEGSSSSNVRLITTLDAAKTEVRMTFSDIGIKCHYGMVQRGYLLWQDFIEAMGDYRVIAVGKKRLMVKRENKGDKPITNGNGRIINIKSIEPGSEESKALVQADIFFDKEQIRWGGVDLMCDKNTGRFYVIETTASWKMHAFHESNFFEDGRRCVDDTGADIWKVLVGELEAGSFD